MAAEVSASFFVKKEAKKLSFIAPWLTVPHGANGQSFFASFCSQKEDSCL
jgi:hypothetical protein